MLWRKTVRFLLWTALVCGVITGIVLIFFEPWTIGGDDAQFAVSIEPSLSVGDFVLVTRSAGGSDGALVRCADPDAAGRYVVGRIVGHGGDKVEFSKGGMLINGTLPTSSSACDPSVVRLRNPATQQDEDYGCALEEFGGASHPVLRSSTAGTVARDSTAEVEPAKIFIASDNRVLHLDSRDFGTVLPSTCQHIAFRLWGMAGWGDTKKRLTVLW